MMSIVDEINANTAYVASAKLALERVLKEKGVQVTADDTSFPTFDQLNTAISGIQAVTDVSGVEETTVYATNNILKGDVCSLVKASGNYIGDVIRTSPTKIKKGSSNISLSSTHKPQTYQRGTYMICFGTDAYAYPFYWNGAEYVQLKVDGSYASIPDTDYSTGSDYDMWLLNNYFDDNKLYAMQKMNYNAQKMRIYDIDTSTLNLTLKHDIEIPDIKNYIEEYMNIYVHNNNIWVTGFYYSYAETSWTRYGVTIQLYYDEEAGTLTAVQNTIGDIESTAFSYRQLNAVFDITYDGKDAVYLYIYSSSTTKGYIRKMTLDNSGVYRFTGQYITLSDIKAETLTLKKTSSSPYWSFTSTIRTPALNMSFGCNSILYITTSGVLKKCIVDTNAMTLTEVELTFSDDLDVTKISSIALAKGSGVLIVQSNDTSLATTDKVRIYIYILGTGIYDLMGTSTGFLNPAAASLTLPYTRPVDYVSADETPYLSSAGSLNIYKIGASSLEYDYYAENCNNILTGANGYAIAKEDISFGSQGTALKILG